MSDPTRSFSCVVRKFDVPLPVGATPIVLPINYANPCSFTIENGAAAITAATVEMAVDFDDDGVTPLWGPAEPEASLLLPATESVQMNLQDVVILAMRLTLTVAAPGSVTIVGRG